MPCLYILTYFREVISPILFNYSHLELISFTRMYRKNGFSSREILSSLNILRMKRYFHLMRIDYICAIFICFSVKEPRRKCLQIHKTWIISDGQKLPVRSLFDDLKRSHVCCGSYTSPLFIGWSPNGVLILTPGLPMDHAEFRSLAFVEIHVVRACITLYGSHESGRRYTRNATVPCEDEPRVIYEVAVIEHASSY